MGSAPLQTRTRKDVGRSKSPSQPPKAAARDPPLQSRQSVPADLQKSTVSLSNVLVALVRNAAAPVEIAACSDSIFAESTAGHMRTEESESRGREATNRARAWNKHPFKSPKPIVVIQMYYNYQSCSLLSSIRSTLWQSSFDNFA